MKPKYKITIEKALPYKVMDARFRDENGKTYNYVGSIPTGVKYEKVQYKTGEINFKSETAFVQEVERLNLEEIIKAINGFK